MTEIVDYCFVCDQPAESDPCPRCATPLFRREEINEVEEAEPQMQVLEPDPPPPQRQRIDRRLLYIVAALLLVALLALATVRWAAGIS